MATLSQGRYGCPRDCLETMRWKQWIKLKLFILPCVLHCLIDASAGLVVRLPECRIIFHLWRVVEEILPHLGIYKLLSMKRGGQKCPQNPKTF